MLQPFNLNSELKLLSSTNEQTTHGVFLKGLSQNHSSISALMHKDTQTSGGQFGELNTQNWCPDQMCRCKPAAEQTVQPLKCAYFSKHSSPHALILFGSKRSSPTGHRNVSSDWFLSCWPLICRGVALATVAFCLIYHSTKLNLIGRDYYIPVIGIGCLNITPLNGTDISLSGCFPQLVF